MKVELLFQGGFTNDQVSEVLGERRRILKRG